KPVWMRWRKEHFGLWSFEKQAHAKYNARVSAEHNHKNKAWALQQELKRRQKKIEKRTEASVAGHTRTREEKALVFLEGVLEAPTVDVITVRDQIAAAKVLAEHEKKNPAGVNVESAQQVVLYQPLVRMPDNGRDPHLQLVQNGQHTLPASNGTNGHEP